MAARSPFARPEAALAGIEETLWRVVDEVPTYRGEGRAFL